MFLRETEMEFCQLIQKLAEENKSTKTQPPYCKIDGRLYISVLILYISNLDIILSTQLILLLCLSFHSFMCNHFTQMDSAGTVLHDITTWKDVGNLHI